METGKSVHHKRELENRICVESKRNNCCVADLADHDLFVNCVSCGKDIHVAYDDRHSLGNDTTALDSLLSSLRILCSQCNNIKPANRKAAPEDILKVLVPGIVPENVRAFRATEDVAKGFRYYHRRVAHYKGHVTRPLKWSQLNSSSEQSLSQSAGARRQRRYRKRHKASINERARARYHSQKLSRTEKPKSIEEQHELSTGQESAYLSSDLDAKGTTEYVCTTKIQGLYRVKVVRDLYELRSYFHTFEGDENDGVEDSEAIAVKVVQDNQGKKTFSISEEQ
ncbi:hypothetical protein FGB62_198g017 [Gracilaria domingensis]|nr:hypothetical protein FGB62_198g017 [Gracilaria domingensis]